MRTVVVKIQAEVVFKMDQGVWLDDVMDHLSIGLEPGLNANLEQFGVLDWAATDSR
jgi:hypothetical protein